MRQHSSINQTHLLLSAPHPIVEPKSTIIWNCWNSRNRSSTRREAGGTESCPFMLRGPFLPTADWRLAKGNPEPPLTSTSSHDDSHKKKTWSGSSTRKGLLCSRGEGAQVREPVLVRQCQSVTKTQNVPLQPSKCK
jgi:hypothetical protein